MKQYHYIFAFFVFFLLIAILCIFGEPTKPKTLPHYTIQYDTVDRYYVDSATHQLMNWKHEKVKYETIEP